MRNKQGLRSYPNRTVAALTLVFLSVSASSAATEKILHNFSMSPKGANPASSLVADAAGNLYGTTSDGGGLGAVFKLTRTSDGKWIETVLHSFSGPPSGGPDGAYPSSGTLTFDSAGALYGATYSGGVYGNGIIFKLTPTSSQWKETVIHSFAGYSSDGAGPNGSMIFDAAGNLYGTTTGGGNNDTCGDQYYPASCGTVFKLSPTSHGSWTETILYNFQGVTDGCDPNAGLVFDKAGNLYGTTYETGGNGYNCFQGSGGTIFKLSPGSSSGWEESIIYSFDFIHGGNPSTGLLLDPAGNLFGATDFGGNCFFCGVVFELSPASGGGWTETVLYSFSGGSNGYQPAGNLAFDSSGNLYGTTEFGGNSSACTLQSGCGTIFELKPQTGTWAETTLYSFTGGSDGDNPLGGVMLGSAGSLFVTTYGGANSSFCSLNSYEVGCGAVLKLKPSAGGKWIPEVLYDFPFLDDGLVPHSNLIADNAGNFYGTTVGGGSGEAGTAFKLTRLANGQWRTNVLHNFVGGKGDGSYPKSALVFDPSGSLYGTTQYGGAGCSNLGCGVVFELVPTGHGWKEKVIYNFQAFPDGANPAAGLVFDSSGNIYGTTFYGGAYDGGVVFKLTPSTAGGWTESVLYSFEGGNAQAGLTLDKDANLYGATLGTVFELSHSSGGWTETVLHNFSGNDGYDLAANLIFDEEGALYGTAEQGGLYNGGVVFKLKPGSGGVWTETVLHNFVGVNGDGAYPASNLVFDNLGNLYGTTTLGGINGGECGGLGCGIAFELTPTQAGEWEERVLHRFTGGLDGGQPYAGFILDPAGNLYSTTSSGGVAAQGTVFEITP